MKATLLVVCLALACCVASEGDLEESMGVAKSTAVKQVRGVALLGLYVLVWGAHMTAYNCV